MRELEDIIKFILNKNLFKKNKRRAFFLLLGLAPNNKYVSKFFIQDKIEEAVLFGFLGEEVFRTLGENYLENIRTDFYQLDQMGFVERVDLSQRKKDDFIRYCRCHVAGSFFVCPPNRRTQIFYRVSHIRGKKRFKEILEEKI